jgi:hypothetical protein
LKKIIDRGLYFSVQSLGNSYPILKHPVTYKKTDLDYIKRKFLQLHLELNSSHYYTTLTVEQLRSIDDLKLILDSLEPVLENSVTKRQVVIKISKINLNHVLKSL